MAISDMSSSSYFPDAVCVMALFWSIAILVLVLILEGLHDAGAPYTGKLLHRWHLCIYLILSVSTIVLTTTSANSDDSPIVDEKSAKKSSDISLPDDDDHDDNHDDKKQKKQKKKKTIRTTERAGWYMQCTQLACHFTCSMAWVGTYHVFIHSSPGVSLLQFLHPAWILSIFGMTAPLIRSTMVSSVSYQCKSIPLFLISLIIVMALHFITHDFDDLPRRVREMGGDMGPNHFPIFFACSLVVFHCAVSYFTFVLEKQDKQAIATLQRKRREKLKTLLGDDEEGLEMREREAEGDCIEISEEEAILLVDGGWRGNGGGVANTSHIRKRRDRFRHRDKENDDKKEKMPSERMITSEKEKGKEKEKGRED